MRRFIVLPLIALACAPSIAAAQLSRWEEPAFDLEDCATNATHILVVDARGRVAEVWKGKATPGDLIPIERFLSSSLARMHCTGSSHPLPDLYGNPSCFHGWPPGCNRFILFLVKSERIDHSIRFLDGWLPASRTGWFASSIARVGLVGDVYVQPRPISELQFGIGDGGHREMEADFKGLVLDAILKRNIWSIDSAP